MQVREGLRDKWDDLKASVPLGTDLPPGLMAAEEHLEQRPVQLGQAIQIAENIANTLQGFMEHDNPEGKPMQCFLREAFAQENIPDMRSPIGREVAELLKEYWQRGEEFKTAYEQECAVLARTGRCIKAVPDSAPLGR